MERQDVMNKSAALSLSEVAPLVKCSAKCPAV